MQQKNSNVFAIEASPLYLLVMNLIKICQKEAMNLDQKCCLFTFSSELNKNPSKKVNACALKLSPFTTFCGKFFKIAKKEQNCVLKASHFCYLL